MTGLAAELARGITLGGYIIVAVLSLYALLAMQNLGRRVIALGWLVSAALWIAFYVWTSIRTPALGAELIPAVLLTRLAHLPVIGTGVATAFVLMDKDRTEARERREMRGLVDDGDAGTSDGRGDGRDGARDGGSGLRLASTGEGR